MRGEAAEPAKPKMVLDAKFRWVAMLVKRLKKTEYLAGAVTDQFLRVHFSIIARNC
jgi:hypothetical protein